MGKYFFVLPDCAVDQPICSFQQLHMCLKSLTWTVILGGKLDILSIYRNENCINMLFSGCGCF